MILRDWLANGWLTEQKTNHQEIVDMLSAVERDLADCNSSGLSPDWRLTIAYTAAMRSAKIALAAEGFRASREQHHYRVIQSLAYTIEAESTLITELDQFRKKRNLSTYEYAGTISDYEANRVIELAIEIRDRVVTWLHRKHPDLIE